MARELSNSKEFLAIFLRSHGFTGLSLSPWGPLQGPPLRGGGHRGGPASLCPTGFRTPPRPVLVLGWAWILGALLGFWLGFWLGFGLALAGFYLAFGGIRLGLALAGFGFIWFGFFALSFTFTRMFAYS